METGWGARAGGSDEWRDADGFFHRHKMARIVLRRNTRLRLWRDGQVPRRRH
jgi:hypothetical protein